MAKTVSQNQEDIQKNILLKQEPIYIGKHLEADLFFTPHETVGCSSASQVNSVDTEIELSSRFIKCEIESQDFEIPSCSEKQDINGCDLPSGKIKKERLSPIPSLSDLNAMSLVLNENADNSATDPKPSKPRRGQTGTREMLQLYENLREISWTEDDTFMDLLRGTDCLRHSRRSASNKAVANIKKEPVDSSPKFATKRLSKSKKKVQNKKAEVAIKKKVQNKKAEVAIKKKVPSLVKPTEAHNKKDFQTNQLKNSKQKKNASVFSAFHNGELNVKPHQNAHTTSFSNTQNKLQEDDGTCKWKTVQENIPTVHPACAAHSSVETAKMFMLSTWKCPDCTICSTCSRCPEEDNMAICSECNKKFHIQCHDSPITINPKKLGKWTCFDCLRHNFGKYEMHQSGTGASVEKDSLVSTPHQQAPTAEVATAFIFQKGLQNYPNVVPVVDKWTVDEVVAFIKYIGFHEEASVFKEKEIDGISLLLLKRSDVVSGLAVQLGPAVKIYSHVRKLQDANSTCMPSIYLPD